MNPPKRLVPALAFLLVACSENAFEPPQEPMIESKAAAALAVAVDDAIERLLPSLNESDRLPALTLSLSEINTALSARHPVQLSNSAEALRSAFDAYVATQDEVEDNPDLAAVRVLLDDLQLMSLSPPLEPSRKR
jgi:hypothetical protein